MTEKISKKITSLKPLRVHARNPRFQVATLQVFHHYIPKEIALPKKQNSTIEGDTRYFPSVMKAADVEKDLGK